MTTSYACVSSAMHEDLAVNFASAFIFSWTIRHGAAEGRYLNNMPLNVLLDDLAKTPGASRENLTTNLASIFNVVNFRATPASAHRGMRSRHVTQRNGAVVQRSSIRKVLNKMIQSCKWPITITSS